VWPESDANLLPVSLKDLPRIRSQHQSAMGHGADFDSLLAPLHLITAPVVKNAACKRRFFMAILLV